MRSRTLAAALAAVLCVVLAACSQSGPKSSSDAAHGPASARPTRTKLSRASSTGYLASDSDVDEDDNGDARAALEPSNHDTFVPRTSGNEANAANRRAIAALIKRYYAAAAAGEGARACPLLYPTTAEGFIQDQGASIQGRERACAAGATSFFHQEHQMLAADNVASMVVIDVRTKGNDATALVGFKTKPIGKLRLKRETTGAWKLTSLLDVGLAT